MPAKYWRDRSQVPFHGTRPLALTAQFLDAGADHLEIVSSTGSVHVSTSHRLGRPFVAGGSPANPPAKAIVLNLGFRGKLVGSAPHSFHAA
jgi:hypothetical protein